MIQIRKNIFETNSSSTHSLVILGRWTYKYALEAVAPDLAKEFEKRLENIFYTKEEMKEALEKIGATLINGTLDLTNVDPKHFDFGYTGPTAYADPAHKLLFALTLYDEEFRYIYSYDPDYYLERFHNMLKDMEINHIINPKNGFTGIDHQSRDEIVDSVKYDIQEFILRKDYVLVLDHD